MKRREVTADEHRRMLEAVRRKNLGTVAMLAFSDRFCKRSVLIQLPLFPEIVHPACWISGDER